MGLATAHPDVSEWNNATPKKQEEKKPQRELTHRQAVIKSTIASAIAMLVVCIVVATYLLIYFGAVWNPLKYYGNVKIAVINQDKGFAGADILKFLLQQNNSFDWQVVDDSKKFQYDLSGLQHDVENYHNHWWGALYIKPNFTENLMHSVTLTLHMSCLFSRTIVNIFVVCSFNGSTTKYDNFVYYVFDEGRMMNTHSYLRRTIDALLRAKSQEYEMKYLTGGDPFLVHEGNSSTSCVSNFLVNGNANPAAVATPIVLKEVNIHPVRNMGENFATYLGFVVMWIGSLLATTVVGKTTAAVNGTCPHYRALLQKMVIALCFSIALALTLSFVLLGFGHDFDSGVENFFRFWFWAAFVCFTFMNFIGVVLVVLGPSGNLLLMILMILQVASGDVITAHAMQPSFYQIGLGLPLYHAIQGARHIIFGSAPDRQALNIGILFVYLLVCFALVTVLGLKALDKKVRKAKGAKYVLHTEHTVASNGHDSNHAELTEYSKDSNSSDFHDAKEDQHASSSSTDVSNSEETVMQAVESTIERVVQLQQGQINVNEVVEQVEDIMRAEKS